MAEVTMVEVEKLFPEVSSEGHWSPPACSPRQILAVIIPFCRRQEQLSIFLRHLIPILMKQLLEFHIIVVEQVRTATRTYISLIQDTQPAHILCLFVWQFQHSEHD